MSLGEISGRQKDARSTSMDVHVGSRIRLRRTQLKLSQERLGDALGLTFQQIQKYEHGVNRVGASRLFYLAEALDVPISFFFDDLPEPLLGEPGAAGFRMQERSNHNMMRNRETMELICAYYRIAEMSVRKRMLELIKSLAPDNEALAPMDSSDIPRTWDRPT